VPAVIFLGQGCPLCQEVIVRLLEIAEWAAQKSQHQRHQRLTDALERSLLRRWQKKWSKMRRLMQVNYNI
jgi:hypothetical protein